MPDLCAISFPNQILNHYRFRRIRSRPLRGNSRQRPQLSHEALRTRVIEVCEKLCMLDVGLQSVTHVVTKCGLKVSDVQNPDVNQILNLFEIVVQPLE